MEKNQQNNVTCKLAYHIVWCTKFRHPVLQEKESVVLKLILNETAIAYDWKVGSLEIMPDHVHILIEAPHTTAPVTIAQTLKSISAVRLFYAFPSLKQKKFWGTGLWSKGTFYGTVGSTSEENIKKYIEQQLKNKII